MDGRVICRRCVLGLLGALHDALAADVRRRRTKGIVRPAVRRKEGPRIRIPQTLVAYALPVLGSVRKD